MEIFVAALIFVGLSVIGLCFNIIFRKNGKFPETEISSNAEMRKRGIRCAKEEVHVRKGRGTRSERKWYTFGKEEEQAAFGQGLPARKRCHPKRIEESRLQRLARSESFTAPLRQDEGGMCAGAACRRVTWRRSRPEGGPGDPGVSHQVWEQEAVCQHAVRRQ